MNHQIIGTPRKTNYDPNLANEVAEQMRQGKFKRSKPQSEPQPEPLISGEDTASEIYIPEAKIYIATELSHLELDWNQTQETLQQEK